MLCPARPQQELLSRREPSDFSRLARRECPRLPSTARIERAHSYRARSASKEGTWPLPPPLFSLLLLHDDCRAASTHHQHRAVGADRFIVEIDADNGIGP